MLLSILKKNSLKSVKKCGVYRVLSTFDPLCARERAITATSPTTPEEGAAAGLPAAGVRHCTTRAVPPARMQQVATLPSHQAGSSRPGCWNCARFGHSWVNCTLPRLRFCRMCGRLGCTIATCPSCCDEWGCRRLQEIEEERVQLEELPPN